MDAPSGLALLLDIEQSENGLIATKYLSAAAFICAAWDHIITFHNEVEYIWRGRAISMAKVVFFFNRYGFDMCAFYVAYIFSGFAVDLNTVSTHFLYLQVCQRFAVTLCLFVICYPCVDNVYLVLRQYVLWDQRRWVNVTLLVVLAITYCPVVVLVFMTMPVYRDNTVFEPHLNTCLILKQPKFIIGAWACLCAFDVFTIIFALANSLHRPHRQHSDALRYFYRDGAVSFVVLFFMRLTSMIVFIVVHPLEEFLGVFLSWSIFAITLSRLILRVEVMKKPRGLVNTWVPATNSYEMGRWSGIVVESDCVVAR